MFDTSTAFHDATVHQQRICDVGIVADLTPEAKDGSHQMLAHNGTALVKNGMRDLMRCWVGNCLLYTSDAADD